MAGIASVLRDREIRVVAIVGCSKNTGKTTTLNRILDSMTGEPGPVGILSMGIDGEETDFWLGVPKPSIHVTSTMLVATGKQVLSKGTARVSPLVSTGIETPLGELVVGRVDSPGTLLLAGIRHKTDLRLLIESLIECGATRVLVDGSYQRLAAADPTLSQGIILSTGAVVGETVTKVAERTREVLERLQVPVVEDPDARKLMEAATGRGLPAFLDGQDRISFLEDTGGRTSLDSVTIAFPGAVTDRWLAAASDPGKGSVQVVARDPTRLFVSPPVIQRFLETNGKLAVLMGIRLLAVTINPYSVTGAYLPRDELLDAIRALGPGAPVFLFEDGHEDKTRPGPRFHRKMP